MDKAIYFAVIHRFFACIAATVPPVAGARFLAQERQQSDAGYGIGSKHLIIRDGGLSFSPRT